MSSIHILSLITFYLRYFRTFILVMFVLNTRLDDLVGDQTGYSNREFLCNLSKCCNVSTLMVNEKKSVMMPPCAIVCHICRTVWLQRAIFSFIKQKTEKIGSAIMFLPIFYFRGKNWYFGLCFFIAIETRTLSSFNLS